jgi:hypothetical protein
MGAADCRSDHGIIHADLIYFNPEERESRMVSYTREFTMNSKLLGFMAAPLLAASMASNAQVVYNYTGVVYSTELLGPGPVEPFSPVPIGTQVSGTYTLDLGNSKIPGSGYWLLQGSSLFSSTFRANSIVYATPIASSAIDVSSEIVGTHSGDTPLYFANEDWSSGAYLGRGGSQLEVFNPHGAWTAAGLPNVAGASDVIGQVNFAVAPTSDAYVFYNITSFTRAPELDSATAAGGLTLLLSGLAMAGSRRSRSARLR